MLRWLAAGGSAVLLVVAAISFLSVNRGQAALPSAPPPEAAASAAPALPGPIERETAPADREAKRLARYDRDKDGSVSREEYLRSRQRAYAKLDTDGDGKLSFEEYAVKTAAKFEAADKDKKGGLSATEFATTATVRKTPRAAQCPPSAEADS